MNANVIAKIGWFVLGFAIGGATGYLVADHIRKNEEEIGGDVQPEFDFSVAARQTSGGVDMAEGESETSWVYHIDGNVVSKEEYDLWLENHPAGEASGKEVVEKLLNDPRWIKATEKARKQEELPKKPGRGPLKTDYTTMSKRNQNKPPLVEVAREKLGLEVVEEAEAHRPRITIISLADYANDGTQEKITFTYYASDDTLCDENEVMIDNRAYLLGDDALKSFGERSGDPDTVYVRNMGNETDFEVVRIKGSYKELVMGEPPDIVEQKIPQKKNSRRTTRMGEQPNEKNEGN